MGDKDRGMGSMRILTVVVSWRCSPRRMRAAVWAPTWRCRIWAWRRWRHDSWRALLWSRLLRPTRHLRSAVDCLMTGCDLTVGGHCLSPAVLHPSIHRLLRPRPPSATVFGSVAVARSSGTYVLPQRLLERRSRDAVTCTRALSYADG